MEDIFAVIKAGSVDQLRDRLERTPAEASSRTDKGLSALLYSLYFGQPGMAELLRSHVEPDIAEAAALGETARVEELLAAGQDQQDARSADGFTVLQLACYFGHPETALLLIRHGADLEAVSDNPMQIRPLHAAAAADNNEAIAGLLEAGADPNAVQQSGFVAIHACAQNCNAEGLKLLLQHGADPALADAEGKAALDFALAAGHAELTEILQSEQQKQA